MARERMTKRSEQRMEVAVGRTRGGRMARGIITEVRIAEGKDDGRKDEGSRITKKRSCSIRT